jgi:hypothetical protein
VRHVETISVLLLLLTLLLTAAWHICELGSFIACALLRLSCVISRAYSVCCCWLWIQGEADTLLQLLHSCSRTMTANTTTSSKTSCHAEGRRCSAAASHGCCAACHCCSCSRCDPVLLQAA